MKKLFMLIWATIGLTGLVMAQSEWLPQPLANYLLYNETTGANGYIDLSSGAAQNAFDEIISLGDDLEANAVLNAYYSDGNSQTLTTGTTPSFFSLSTYAAQGYTLNFLEDQQTVTGLAVSALGGLYFTNNATQTAITCSPAGTDLADIEADYAVVIYPYKNGTLLEASKNGNETPAYLGIGHNEAGLFIVVQYNYTINGVSWKFQLKVSNDGVFLLGDKFNQGSGTPSLALGIKRQSDTLLIGNPYDTPPLAINDKTQGWKIDKIETFKPNSPIRLDNTTISVLPPLAKITSVSAAYVTCSANILTSETGRTTLDGKDLLAFVSHHPNPTITWNYETANYQVGDLFSGQHPVVYRGKTDIGGNTFQINCSHLSSNEKYYLILAYNIGTDKDILWRYVTVSEQFSTGTITSPQGVTAGSPNGNKIPLTIQPADEDTMMVVKSAWVQCIYPTGFLKEDDTYNNYRAEIGTAEFVNNGTVVAFLEPGTTSYDLEMTPGEAVYVQIYGAANVKTADAAYTETMVMTPVYLPATALPLSYTFSGKDLLDKHPDDAMPILPPGMGTSTVLPTDETEKAIVRSSAFYVQAPNDREREDAYLTSWYAENDTRWNDVIAPVFSGAARILATFHVKLLTLGQTPGSTTNYTPTVGDSIRLEYNLNGGEWQLAKLFIHSNLPENNAGLYPLTAEISCTTTDFVQVRYSYRTKSQSLMHAIKSYEFINAGDCEPPTKLQVLNDETTDKAVVLTWKDNNAPATENYLVSYRKATASAPDNEDDAWETLTASTTKATLQNLETGTTYNVKVQAVCSFATSIASTPIQAAVPVGMPYVEDMTFVWDNDLFDYSTKPNLTAYNGEPGTEPEQDDYLSSNTTWSIDYGKAYYIDDASDPDALGVATDMDKALLATPAIYVRKASLPMPKRLTFRVNTYNRIVENDQVSSQNGIDLIDPALRLYVLASTNGTFTWKDTVAAFDHNALKAETAAKDGKRGKDLSVELAELGGLVQFAFYFHNPNPFVPTANENAFPKYLEILGISFRYDGGDNLCFPVENLKATKVNETDATLSWNGDGAEYGITYYPANDEAKAKTVYQDAKDTELQTITLEGLTSYTNYKAEVVSYCTKGDREHGSMAVSVTFKTLRELFELTVTVTPEKAGTVTGDGSYFEGGNVKLTASANEGYKFVAWKEGETELSKDTVYTFKMPNANLAYTAVFEKDSSEQPVVGIEDLIKANFSVSTHDGQLFVRNLNGTLVKDLDVYGLTGNRIHRFTPNSREDLILPLDVERALIFVRINSEKGAAVYKIYIH